MISEPVIHDIIYKLLTAARESNLDNRLECICILLRTVGKDIDHIIERVTMI